MPNSPIFFSYSRKDSEFVFELGNQLRDAGAEIWLDQLDIEPGTNWDDSIQEALRQANTMIVVLSKTSVESQNVSDEYSYAIDEGKRVVPVLLEPCDVPFRLRRLQYADFSADPNKGIQTLIETLDLNHDVAKKLSGDGSKIKPIKRNVSTNKKRGLIAPISLGIAVLTILLFILYKFDVFQSSANSASQVTVLVHDVSGKDQLVLPNRGQVKLIYGDANVIETINAKGEATFKQIPANFFNDNAKVEVLFLDPEGEPYRAVYPDSSYVLYSGSYIALPVQLFGLDKVQGIVKDFVSGDPIDSVRVSISGIETYSNSFGEYHLEIPPKQQRKFQTIRAFKNGFELYEESNIPIQTDQELPIILKPKQTP